MNQISVNITRFTNEIDVKKKLKHQIIIIKNLN